MTIFLRVDYRFMSQLQTTRAKSIKEAVERMEKAYPRLKGRVTGSFHRYSGIYGNPKGTRE